MIIIALIGAIISGFGFAIGCSLANAMLRNAGTIAAKVGTWSRNADYAEIARKAAEIRMRDRTRLYKSGALKYAALFILLTAGFGAPAVICGIVVAVGFYMYRRFRLRAADARNATLLIEDRRFR